MKIYHGSASNVPPPRVHAPGRTLHLRRWGSRAWVAIFFIAALGLLWQRYHAVTRQHSTHGAR